MNWINVRMVSAILSLNLIVSCATVLSSPKISSNTLLKNNEQSLVHVGPEIPFNNQEAFYPIHPGLNGFWYPYEDCERRIIICTKWVWKHAFIEVTFKNLEDAKWLYSNDFGLKKRSKP